LEHQVEDVQKAEERLYVQDEAGILFTNQTGTGKTIVGAGLIKRSLKLFPNEPILIVTPTDKKCKDWILECSYLGIRVYQLQDTRDAGRLVSTTTYANFRENIPLQCRKFQYIIYDECHKIMQNGLGKETSALEAHRRTANPSNSTKVVFLSATPFAYVQNLEYADGYLFKMGNRAKFLMDNFGYTLLEDGKLMQPAIGVDVGILEREFADRLIKSGAMSTRKIKIPFDYSREFVLMGDTLGLQIDEGYMRIGDVKQFPFLSQAISGKFDYRYTSQLLECIKARQAVPRIKEHLALGRKVVVFHAYNHSLPSHPFEMRAENFKNYLDVNKIMREVSLFHQLYPEYGNLDVRDLKNPIATMKEAFGNNVVFFNGEVGKAKRSSDLDYFNADSGVDVFCVQVDAGKEGISLHDKTSAKQRVTINLMLPTAPTTAIQAEGRIYREGNKTDAIIEYPVLHTAFEKFVFADRISKRVRTAENLALGSQARNLEITFKEGYLNPTSDKPHKGQGKGGKKADMLFDHPDEFEKAKTFYYKRVAKKDNKALVPEPLGYKIVQWLSARPCDCLLDANAGIASVSRYFKANTDNTIIETDIKLRSQASIYVEAVERLMCEGFEELHITNKYQGIVFLNRENIDFMLTKAIKHLKQTGRLIFIIPFKDLSDYFYKNINSVLRATIIIPSCVFGSEFILFVIDKVLVKEIIPLLPPTEYVDLSSISTIDKFFEAIKDITIIERLVEPDKVVKVEKHYTWQY